MPAPGARFSREQLIFKALCVLDQAIDDAGQGRVKPSYGLRFALAFLFAVSDDRLGIATTARQVFDEFWDCVTTDPPGQTAYMTGFVRSTYARTYMTGICRRVGMPLSVDLQHRLSVARGVIVDRPSRPHGEASALPTGDQGPELVAGGDQAGTDQPRHDRPLDPARR